MMVSGGLYLLHQHEVLMIDGTKALHELCEIVQQLSYIEQHSIALQKYRNVILERTYAKAPTGRNNNGQSYELNRGERPDPTGERLLEKQIWKQWRFQDSFSNLAFYGDTCRYIQTYQMPLQGTRNDHGWGRIDLVGVTNQLLPVVIELKHDRGSENVNDTPLRMLVEAVAYAVAVRKAWNEGPFRTEWNDAVNTTHQRDLDTTITEVPVILLAPFGYWQRAIGVLGKHTNGKVKEQAWPPFIQLARQFGNHGFPVHFVQFETLNLEGTTSNMTHVVLPGLE